MWYSFLSKIIVNEKKLLSNIVQPLQPAEKDSLNDYLQENVVKFNNYLDVLLFTILINLFINRVTMNKQYIHSKLGGVL